MITGRQALATVEQAIGRARAEEGRLDAALRSASEEAVRLRTARMDAFKELARLKLDEGLMGEIDAIEARALALVEEGRRNFDRVSTLRTRAQENAEMAETGRHARAADYEKAVKELHELRSRIEADAVVTAAWAAQSDRIEQLRNVADKADAKAAQAEADRDLKRKPYDADPLFRYLWQRRFGTPDYRSGALTRFIDGWVARLIGYSGARANYALLNDLPSRLREHVSYMRKELQVEEARLKTIEREALVNAGIGPLEQRATDSKAALDAAEKTLADARTALAELDSKYKAVLDAPYQQAVELLAKADAARDLHVLRAEARRTASPKDEALLRSIEEIETAIGGAEQELGTIRKEMRELASRRSQIEHERDEFRSRGYDNPYGTFGNEQVLGNVLGGILGGILQGSVLRDVLTKVTADKVDPGTRTSGAGIGTFPQAATPSGARGSRPAGRSRPSRCSGGLSVRWRPRRPRV